MFDFLAWLVLLWLVARLLRTGDRRLWLAFGTVADRYARPLRLYGFLEVGAGVSGALAVWVLGSGREMLVPVLRIAGGGAADRAVACGVALIVLLVPTSLMGGTLPALTRLAVRDPRRIHGPLGSLYGVNTLGGSVGAFASGRGDLSERAEDLLRGIGRRARGRR